MNLREQSNRSIALLANHHVYRTDVTEDDRDLYVL